MVRDAGFANWRPAGWNVIALTVSAERLAVIVTFCESAPAGTTNVCGPTVSDPPQGPIVAVDVALGSGVHLSSPRFWARLPTKPVTSPSRSFCGPDVARTAKLEFVGAALTPRGPWSAQFATTKAIIPTSNRRVAFIPQSPDRGESTESGYRRPRTFVDCDSSHVDEVTFFLREIWYW